MIEVLSSLALLQGGAVPVPDVCALNAAHYPAGTSIEISGRFFSDYMHFNGLMQDDLSCSMGWAFAPGVDETPLGRSFVEETWGRRPTFGDTSLSKFNVRVMGEIRGDDAGRSYLLVTRLDAFSIDGVSQ